MGLHAK